MADKDYSELICLRLFLQFNIVKNYIRTKINKAAKEKAIGKIQRE